jgi:diguanylate cyclase (GGDEF)-like protein
MSSYIVWLMIRDKQHLEVLLSERTEELQFLVDHDVLTGVYNRRVFSRVLNDMIMLNKKFALIVFDIDKFKCINDRYGHIVGDEVLIHVVHVIQKVLLKDDVLVRISGDEFCVISSISSHALLKKHLSYICHQVASSNYKFNGDTIPCTLSIGATIRNAESLEDLIQSSDAQLYSSKKAGRNCVSIA